MMLRIEHICLILFAVIMAGGLLATGVAAESEEERSHRLSLFGGVTQESSEYGASTGLEYEFRINTLLGIGVMGEYAGGNFDSWVLGVPFFLHPYAGLAFWLVPGVEIVESESSFLFRTGVGYDVELTPEWSLAPEFNVDMTEEDTKLVYGVSLSWKF